MVNSLLFFFRASNSDYFFEVIVPLMKVNKKQLQLPLTPALYAKFIFFYPNS